MKMRKKLAVMASAIMLMGTFPQTVLTVCAEETPQTATTMVTTAYLNVRAGDSASTKLLGSLKKGQSVTVTGKTAKGWYIIDYSGQTGYVSGKYLTDITTPAAETAPTPATVAESKPTPATQDGTTKIFSNGQTFVVKGQTPKDLNIWYIQGDNGTWPDYMIAAYDATGITNDMSDYDKAVAINNYICKVVDYAYEDGVDDRAAYSACLTYGKAICVGYSHAFDCLCTMAGVYDNQVVGTLNANNVTHAWNYVLIGDTKYWVDPTLNDSNNNAYLMSTSPFSDHIFGYEE